MNHTRLAKRLNVSRPYVVKVLHGDVNISFGTAIRFAKALEMDFVPVLIPRDKMTTRSSAFKFHDSKRFGR